MWGPAPAVTPANYKQNNNSTLVINEETKAAAIANATSASKDKRGKKKKMSKVDTSLLGFSCSADSGRVNIGEIETVDKA